jgi:hypothetical protein
VIFVVPPGRYHIGDPPRMRRSRRPSGSSVAGNERLRLTSRSQHQPRGAKKSEGKEMGFTIGQKTCRMVRFLRGLAQPGVVDALKAYGFTGADRDEGWRLLRSSTGEWMTRSRPTPTRAADPTIIQQLDAWENRWFPIARVTLRRRKPAVADRVFLNLSQTSGIGVILTVGAFIRRVRQLETDGPDGQEALAILRSRGLTDDVLARAETLLKSLCDVEQDAAMVRDPQADAARRKQAEDGMWSWYREWSTIARKAVDDGNSLRALGLGTAGATPAGGDGAGGSRRWSGHRRAAPEHVEPVGAEAQ